MSEVRGRSWEDPMPEGQRPRGVTPRPRSGAAAESTRLRQRRNGGEELPCVRGQRGRPRGDTQRPRSGMVTRGATPRPHAREQGMAAGRSNPRPRPGARREAIPHTPSPRPGATGGRSYPTPLSPRPRAAAGRSNRTTEARAVAGRSNPTSREPWLRGRRRA